MKLYLIRHLPTLWNNQELLQGSQDVDLLIPDKNTWKKIHKNKDILRRRYPFDLVLSSELKRCQQTAHLYGFKDVTIDRLLNELNFGEFEGKSKHQLDRVLQSAWTLNPRSLKLGESLVDFESRIFRFLQNYRHYEKLLIFGHGAWIRGLLSIVKWGTIDQMNLMTIPNNSLIETEFDFDSFQDRGIIKLN